MTGIKSWFQRLMTGADNLTPEPGRHGWLFANLAVATAAIVSAWHGVINLVELATALGIANTAGAVSSKLTETSQPKPEEKSSASVTVMDSTASVEVDSNHP